MVRSKQSTLMEAASNSSTHLIAMVRLGDSKSLKRKVLSWHVVMVTSFTSSASRTRRCSENERYGPSTSTVESHMRQTRSSLLPLLSVQLQCISKLVQLLTARSGTMSLSQTTSVMSPSLTNRTIKWLIREREKERPDHAKTARDTSLPFLPGEGKKNKEILF